ncbi:uncharacterized protein LOC134538642 [Bacillus rossius redtenbacheri]|uniref:uncharacterized protein LOC134538642 n=1 Tax=Bacillus rossius redtenbacheri TaxID=93214 RepID=UPI002FDED190
MGLSLFWLLNSAAVFLHVFLHLANGFAGGTPDCSSTKACLPHQMCVHGYCHCEAGFVELNYTCFKVRGHGEDCYFDEQCPDHRMSCRKDENSSLSVKYCLCNKYHPWNEEAKECIQAANIKIMILSLLEKFDTGKVLRDEADRVFSFTRISAFLVLILGSLLATGCIAYGCFSCACCSRNKGNKKLTDMSKKSQKSWDAVACSMAVNEVVMDF